MKAWAQATTLRERPQNLLYTLHSIHQNSATRKHRHHTLFRGQNEDTKKPTGNVCAPEDRRYPRNTTRAHTCPWPVHQSCLCRRALARTADLLAEATTVRVAGTPAWRAAAPAAHVHVPLARRAERDLARVARAAARLTQGSPVLCDAIALTLDALDVHTLPLAATCHATHCRRRLLLVAPWATRCKRRWCAWLAALGLTPSTRRGCTSRAGCAAVRATTACTTACAAAATAVCAAATTTSAAAATSTWSIDGFGWCATERGDCLEDGILVGSGGQWIGRLLLGLGHGCLRVRRLLFGRRSEA